MTRQQALEKIKELVEKFNNFSEKEKSRFNEEQTKSYFIRPLFEALGWNFSDYSEVSLEQNITGKRADYEFKINGIPKMYVEAKAIKVDLDLEIHARQAINYAWNKGVNWAVLTDFEGLKVFNAQGQSKLLADKLVFEIKATNYKNDFERLILLSKESFLANGLDKYAEKYGKKIKKQTVNEKLFSDLREAREILTKSFKIWNEKLKNNQELLEEGVQRILDRIIFIRVLEDRGIEPPTLKEILHQRDNLGANAQLFPLLIKKFRELDELYNSNIFSEHACENWEEYDNKLRDVINLFYGNDIYEYDFSKIPADVLGGVYESYLSYMAQKPIEIDSIGESGKLFKVEDKKDLKQKSRKKRKEQGIYYTPKFIVDYIVENTLGKKLAEAKNMVDLKKIKILDPACGSGSFLTKALKTMNEKYRDFGSRADGQSIKTEVLLNNIYGVDLDTQAVELAKLNLLIETLDKKAKLPDLTGNIRVGNSLISGDETELKKYFGDSWRAKHPFNWQEEFSEVFKNDGFDVIIGNPPYIRNRELLEADKKYFGELYFSSEGQYDIYQLFFEKAIKLLKDGGLLGFITSNKYAIADYGKKLREFILGNCKIVSIVDVSSIQVFKDASTYPYIIVLQKNKNNNNNKVKCYKINDDFGVNKEEIIIDQDNIKNSTDKNFTIKREYDFINRIEKNSDKLGDIATIKETIHTGNIREKLIVDEPIDEDCKKLLAGKDCHRYWFNWGKKYIRYNKNLINKENGEYGNLCEGKYFEKPKILLRDISKYPEAVFDNEKYYTVNTLYSIQSINDYDLLYLLACINSKLIKFYFLQKFEDAHVSGGFLRFKKIYTSQIPIYKINFSNKDEKKHYNDLIKLADLITSLYKQLQSIPENSDKWSAIKKEIENTDKEIDKKVYKLYGLTEEEIKIVEGK